MKMSNAILNHNFQYRRQRTQKMSTEELYLKYYFDRAVNVTDFISVG